MKVLIASGGSGGHIFPALSLARELSKEKSDIVFVASRRYLDRGLLEKEGYRKEFLSANPMPYRFGFKWCIFIAKLLSDILYATYMLIRHKPCVVVGFGGYTSGTIVLLASIMRMKTVIHEQNVVPGRTNRFLDGFVGEVAVSFEETKKYFKNKNVVFTGNPLREESLTECCAAAQEKFGLDKEKTTLLVMGGSQGAKSLNDMVSSSLSSLPEDKRKKLQVLHIAGPRNRDAVQETYDKNGVDGKVYGFIRSINKAYSACDLAISRSGAAAIFELAAHGKPMILVPYPHEKNNQCFNARFFAEREAGICVDEKNTDQKELSDLIVELAENPARRKLFSENAKKLIVTDGARRLKEEVLKC